MSAACYECAKPARWFVISGPAFVCWNHCQQLRAQGEEVVRSES